MFAVLEDAALEVARAEAITALAMDLRRCTRCARVERVWSRCCGRTIQRRLETTIKVTGMIGAHRDRVMNAVTSDATGDIRAASLESRIRWIKGKACGYRNRDGCRNASYVHLGGLDLHPESLQLAHTTS